MTDTARQVLQEVMQHVPVETIQHIQRLLAQERRAVGKVGVFVPCELLIRMAEVANNDE